MVKEPLSWQILVGSTIRVLRRTMRSSLIMASLGMKHGPIMSIIGNLCPQARISIHLSAIWMHEKSCRRRRSKSRFDFGWIIESFYWSTWWCAGLTFSDQESSSALVLWDGASMSFCTQLNSATDVVRQYSWLGRIDNTNSEFLWWAAKWREYV